MVVTILVLLTFLSIVMCHYISKKRGAKPVFWGVMGAVFGPLAIPFAYMAKPDLE